MNDPSTPIPKPPPKPTVMVHFTQEEINVLNMALSAYIVRRRANSTLVALLKSLEKRLFAAHSLFGPLPGLSLRPQPRPRPPINREGMKAIMQEEIAEETAHIADEEE